MAQRAAQRVAVESVVATVAPRAATTVAVAKVEATAAVAREQVARAVVQVA